MNDIERSKIFGTTTSISLYLCNLYRYICQNRKWETILVFKKKRYILKFHNKSILISSHTEVINFIPYKGVILFSIISKEFMYPILCIRLFENLIIRPNISVRSYQKTSESNRKNTKSLSVLQFYSLSYKILCY